MQLAVRIVGLAARLLIALGLVCLLLGGYLVWQTADFRSTALPATGTVVSYHEVSDDGRARYRPRVRFKTASGDIFAVPGQMDYTSKRIPVGSEVRVMYQPADPARMRIAAFFEDWLGATVATVVGLLCFTGGTFVRRSLKRNP
jgi:hypothetical protein